MVQDCSHVSWKHIGLAINLMKGCIAQVTDFILQAIQGLQHVVAVQVLVNNAFEVQVSQACSHLLEQHHLLPDCESVATFTQLLTILHCICNTLRHSTADACHYCTLGPRCQAVNLASSNDTTGQKASRVHQQSNQAYCYT